MTLSRRKVLGAFAGVVPTIGMTEKMATPGIVTPEVAAKYAVYAMASSNCYHQPPSEKLYFPIHLIGWEQVDLNGSPTKKATFAPDSGLAYDIYEHRDSNASIFAFRGTDSLYDYISASLKFGPWSGQYRAGRQEFVKYAKRRPERTIVLTGHSLGGGLALSASVRQDVATDANVTGFDSVTFDPSPRVFDGLGDHHAYASRVVIYEDGEILQKVRPLWQRKFYSIVQRDNVYRADYDFGPPDSRKFKLLSDATRRHRADFLAAGLLEAGARVDPNLKIVFEATQE